MDHEAAGAVEPAVTDTAAMPAVVVWRAFICREDVCGEVHSGELLVRRPLRWLENWANKVRAKDFSC